MSEFKQSADLTEKDGKYVVTHYVSPHYRKTYNFSSKSKAETKLASVKYWIDIDNKGKHKFI